MLFPALFFLLLGSLTSWLAILLCLRAGIGQGGASEPQHHHTHTGVVPRIGGIGILLGFSITYLLCFLYLDRLDNKSLIHYAIIAGAVASFLLGLIDDFKPLGAKVKLLAQIIIAMLAMRAVFPSRIFRFRLRIPSLISVFWGYLLRSSGSFRS